MASNNRALAGNQAAGAAGAEASDQDSNMVVTEALVGSLNPSKWKIN